MKKTMAIILAALMLLSTLAGVFSLTVYAEEEAVVDKTHVDVSQIVIKRNDGGKISGKLADNGTYSVLFELTLNDNIENITSIHGLKFGHRYSELFINNPKNYKSDGEGLDLDNQSDATKNHFLQEGKRLTIYLVNVKYNEDGSYPSLSFFINDKQDKYSTSSISVPSEYVKQKKDPSSDDEYDEAIASDIVVENVILKDSTGDRIDAVTKKSPKFTMEILYYDLGMANVDEDQLDTDNMTAFITSNGGFLTTSGTKGTVRKVAGSGEYPRFRATFKNLTYDGGANTISFRVQYNIDEKRYKGEGLTTVYQAKPDKEGEDDKKIAPPTPYIIISQYSYGEQQIEAGTIFPLNLSFTNTSKDIPLENIVMTLTTGEDLSISSSSNTLYVPNMGAGASVGHKVDILAKAASKAGGHSITVDFTYEYITSDERKEVKKSESISIPVMQVDRFAVDPITEELFMEVGSEGYIPISFINRGKSPTYNISATIKTDDPLTASPEHFGNLEAGQSDSLDLLVNANEPGTFSGNVLIQYEDENNNQKEVEVPFSIIVEEPFMPPFEPQNPEEMMPMEPENKMHPLSLTLCILGGLAIAVPVSLYLMKRVKSGGIEEEYEDI